MSGPPFPSFPLDAEQLVRLTGAVLTRVLNAIRHPDAKPVSEAGLTLDLADSAGVAVPTAGERWDRRLLPYGSEVTAEPSPSSSQEARGGSDAA